MRTRHFLRSLYIIAIVAFAIRMIVGLQLLTQTSVMRPSTVTDMFTYQNLASEILKGHWPDHFDYQPFYYTVFLPVIYAFGRVLSPLCAGICGIFGSGNNADTILPYLQAFLVMTVQALCSSLAVYFIGISAAKIRGRATGLTAAILLALARYHVFMTPFLLYEVLNSFWIAMLFWLLLRAWQKNSWLSWLTASAVLSLAALTRGNALLFLPGILCFLIWKNRGRLLRGLAIAAASTAIFILPQLPFSIVNYHYTGRWCGASTAGDKVLALGNTPEAPPGGLEYPLTYHRWVGDSDARPENGRISVPRHMLQWFAQAPLEVIELKFRALLLFWDQQEIANNISIHHDGRHSFLLRLPLLFPYWLLAAPALAALFSCWKRHSPRHLILFYFVLMYCAGTVLFYILSRFRIGIIPLLCVNAAIFIQELISSYRRKDAFPKPFGLRMLAGFFSLFIVMFAFSSYQDLLECSIIRWLRPNGTAVLFEHDTLLYDHGPLTVGGATWLPTQSKDLSIHKRIVIPPSTREQHLNQPWMVRIPVLITADSPYQACFIHQGQSFKPVLVHDRFMTWLQAEIPHLTIDSDGNAVFDFYFQSAASCNIGVDRLRYYGRSSFMQGETALPLPVEACIELQASH